MNVVERIEKNINENVNSGKEKHIREKRGGGGGGDDENCGSDG